MKVHCIGIGGIGVSALAQYYLSKGYFVSGSDLEMSEITDFLEEKGVKIFEKQIAENITDDLDLVIYSPAIEENNKELVKARELEIEYKSYPEALGELTKEYFTIAIAGSHGKSTITSMIGLMLKRADLDPTVIVGTKVKEFGSSNFRKGEGKYLVIEACEYDDSFLHYEPKIIVLTGIDKEHLDYFKTFENEIGEFQKFVSKLGTDGVLIINKDDKGNSNIKTDNIVKEYSLSQKEYKELKSTLKIPGDHNISNALAALSVANILGINKGVALESLSKFEGTWRRFEVREVEIDGNKITLISDYAHHPTEILATLKATKEKYFNKKILCVFQPHQVQRTNYLWNEFIELFKKDFTDQIVVTDIYDVAGREVKSLDSEVSSEKLVESVDKKNIKYVSFDKIEDYIKNNSKDIEVLIIMGAGSIYKIADRL